MPEYKFQNDPDLINIELPKFLSYIPPYGPIGGYEIEDQDKQIIFNHNTIELLFLYLISNGFAIPRTDMNSKNIIFIQLTNTGRELRECGNLTVFNLTVETNNRKMKLQDQRSANLYWINLWIMVGAISAAIYYLLEILNHFFQIYPSRK